VVPLITGALPEVHSGQEGEHLRDTRAPRERADLASLPVEHCEDGDAGEFPAQGGEVGGILESKSPEAAETALHKTKLPLRVW